MRSAPVSISSPGHCRLLRCSVRSAAQPAELGDCAEVALGAVGAEAGLGADCAETGEGAEGADWADTGLGADCTFCCFGAGAGDGADCAVGAAAFCAGFGAGFGADFCAGFGAGAGDGADCAVGAEACGAGDAAVGADGVVGEGALVALAMSSTGGTRSGDGALALAAETTSR